jgi:hypothetical protein
MTIRRDHRLAAVLALVLMSGCGGAEVPSPSASGAQSVGSPGASAPNDCPLQGGVTDTHQDAELEGLLPPSVAGRQLTRWSLAGACWLWAMNDPETAGQIETDARSEGVLIDDVSFGMDGRTDPDADPPYMVQGVRVPDHDATVQFALSVLAANVGFVSLDEFWSGDFELRTIGGKEILVGASTMLVQDEHQRGMPYMYDAGEYVFIVVTDDEAWAIEAISQLP